jgi:membrane-associated phospholipid phosphatase
MTYYGRQAAGNHYASDVAVGAGLGWAVGRICE